jgi:hypothetical protein
MLSRTMMKYINAALRDAWYISTCGADETRSADIRPKTTTTDESNRSHS